MSVPGGSGREFNYPDVGAGRELSSRPVVDGIADDQW